VEEADCPANDVGCTVDKIDLSGWTRGWGGAADAIGLLCPPLTACPPSGPDGNE